MEPAKIYNRKTKKWEQATENVGVLKSRTTCKGGRPHEISLVLPPYLFYNQPEPDFTQEQIERYYEIEETRLSLDIACDDRLELELGMKRKVFMFNRVVHRHYKCSVCGKLNPKQNPQQSEG